MTYMKTAKSSEWETPQQLFDKVNTVYGFTLDVCATLENTKVARFFTEEEDGLKQDWGGEICWMNPPYGRVIAKWMKKAYESARASGAIVVCLVPARTDTAWFHDYAQKGVIQFIRGRLAFGNGKGTPHHAPFASMFVTFDYRQQAAE